MGCCTVLCIAPKGLGSSADIASALSARTLGGAAAATAAAIGVRVAASWAMRTCEPSDKPAHYHSAGPSTARSSKGMSVSEFNRRLPAEEVGGDDSKEEKDSYSVEEDELLDEDGMQCEFDDEKEPLVDSDDEWEGEEELFDEECPGCVAEEEVVTDAPILSGKLWTKAQFPAGVTGPYNWDKKNLEAAQAWSCPCGDRENCIGADRLCVLKLYDYRQQFRQTRAKENGGLRDATRKELEGHYDQTTGSFTRSFVVGPLGDCCAASAALAKGLSFQTFANARADVTKGRVLRPERNKQRLREESEKRRHLRAWIRAERNTMEAPKGGSDPVDKWRTGYMPRHKRWDLYCESRRRNSLPIIVSEALL